MVKEEKFKDIIDEALPLLTKHWKELANHQDIRPLDINFEAYEQMNDLGLIRVFTVREDEKLVGYASFCINYNLHYKTWKHAICDVYYIAPEKRTLGFGSKMFSEIEGMLRDLGVNSVIVQDKVKQSNAKFFQALGFGISEQHYEKVL